MLKLHTVGDRAYLEGSPEDLASLAALAKGKDMEALVGRINLHFDDTALAAHAGAQADYERAAMDPNRMTWQEPPQQTRALTVFPGELPAVYEMLASGHETLPKGAGEVAKQIASGGR